MNQPGTAIIVFAHGSKQEAANEAVAQLAGQLSRKTGLPACPAFLDVAAPDLAAAAAEAVRGGARRVLIVPCFLVLGVHVRQDLPRLVGALETAHPGVEFVVSQPLEGHPGLAEILAHRVQESLGGEAVAVREQAEG